MNRWLRFLPLAVLLLLVGGLAWRLAVPASEEVRSKLAGKPVPTFQLDAAVPGKPGLASADLASGQPRMVNVFASWCVPCIAEAPLLLEMSKGGIPIDAIAVRDRQEDVEQFLARHGDPFQRIGTDPESRVQLALGSSGVPETFIVDGRGIIRYQHLGPIEPADLPALMREWQAAR
ncbi:DsbE family thiol:disulfide interchange protein [Sphingomonas sp. LY29]|uniref:DsbE family thiol:disulfide interchange protein n=1 Tax=unclassified Sphingomonas TaxID=196159 RepID=UPI002ADEF197|nr:MULTISPECIES: DsbE family thiol:disulfide interchange protein [unclassified Sphingomonas]MEA1071094.1 DsbE family thiol:disulfide interchange protein [Sphingomonas sp. LY160]WRP26183.1 DsbE family thiol:disulfide interchange protein [Sphingomonas sp. LY29]